jgi:hypothetical protein
MIIADPKKMPVSVFQESSMIFTHNIYLYISIIFPLVGGFKIFNFSIDWEEYSQLTNSYFSEG